MTSTPRVTQNCPNPEDDPLGEILAEWLELAEVEEFPDIRTFLTRHAQHAHVLEPYLREWQIFRLSTIKFQNALRDRTNDSTLPGARAPRHRREADFPDRINDFELLEELGRGGMGVVFRARQVSLGRLVALKVLRHQDATAAQIQRLQNEAMLAARLEHPNIVPVYQVGESNGQPFFCMKIIDGEGLDRRLGYFPQHPKEAARVLATVAHAVYHAHQRGILHRDIKPSNILVDSAGVPHVSDFGLAKQMESDSNLTQTGALVGTPSYMAPEQTVANNDQVTVAADIYGLGAVLYALLTGRPPFRGSNILNTIQQVQSNDPVSPASLNRAIDTDLQTICLKCLNKEPAHRYATARDLALDLERWLAGEPIQAKPVSTWQRWVKWVRRQPMTASFVAVCILAFAGFVVGLVVYNQQIGMALEVSNELRENGLKREAELRRLLYIADMRSTKLMFDNGDLEGAKQHLANWIPKDGDEDLRGFEWNYLDRIVHTEPTILGKHDSPIASIALSPDERWLATAGRNAVVKIWDLTTRKVVHEFRAAKRDFSVLRFSPDGKTLATGSREYFIRMWDTATWKENAPLLGFVNTVRSLEFSHDGKRLAAATLGNTVVVWKLPDLLPTSVLSDHTDHVSVVSWSPDDRRLLSSSNDGHSIVWDAKTYKKIHVLEKSNHLLKVHANAIAPTKPWFVTGGTDQYLRIWHAKTFTPLISFGMQSGVRAATFSADSRYLAVGAKRGAIALIEHTDNSQEHQLRRFLRDGSNDQLNLVFTKNGNTLFTGTETGEVKIWNVTELLGVARKPNLVTHIAASASGRFLALRAFDQLQVIDLPKHAQVKHVRSEVDQNGLVAVAGSGTTLAFEEAQGKVVILNLITGKRQCVLDSTHVKSTSDLVMTHKGDRVALVSDQGGVHVFETNEGKLISELAPHASGVKEMIHAAAFVHQDRELVVRSENREAKIQRWEIASGTKLLDRITGPRRTTESYRVPIAISPNHRWIATVIGERLIQILDFETGEEYCTFTGHSNHVTGLVFHQDSERLVSTGLDCQVRLWHLPTKQEIFTFYTTRATPFLPIFTADGKSLVVPLGVGETCYWDISKR